MWYKWEKALLCLLANRRYPYVLFDTKHEVGSYRNMFHNRPSKVSEQISVTLHYYGVWCWRRWIFRLQNWRRKSKSFAKPIKWWIWCFSFWERKREHQWEGKQRGYQHWTIDNSPVHVEEFVKRTGPTSQVPEDGTALDFFLLRWPEDLFEKNCGGNQPSCRTVHSNKTRPEVACNSMRRNACILHVECFVWNKVLARNKNVLVKRQLYWCSNHSKSNAGELLREDSTTSLFKQLFQHVTAR